MTEQLDSTIAVGESSSKFDIGLRPMLLTAGEATLFLAAVEPDGTSGRRAPVVTLVAPALIALDQAPAGWRWVVGRGLGSALQEATLETDEGPIRKAFAETIAALGVLLQPAESPPAERLVHLRGRKTRIPEGHGAIVDETAWVQPVTGRSTIAGVAVPPEGAPFTRRLVLRGEGDVWVVARPPQSSRSRPCAPASSGCSRSRRTTCSTRGRDARSARHGSRSIMMSTPRRLSCRQCDCWPNSFARDRSC